MKSRRLAKVVLALAALALSAPAIAAGPSSAADSSAAEIRFTLDEHVLTDARRDQDFDGGGEVAVSGAPARRAGFIFQRILEAIDRADEVETAGSASAVRPGYAFAAGLIILTPSDLSAPLPVRGDRPYASLFFVSGGRRIVSAAGSAVYDSTLTFGMLGLSAAASVQKALHRLTDSTPPEGWSHQISAGGEPTARYSLARQVLIVQRPRAGSGTLDAKWTLQGSIGTITEGGAAIDMRWGHIASPWWAFAPAENTYVRDSQPAPPPLERRAAPEFWVTAGARLKIRAYDAFLQGQFRHSDVRLRYRDLNPLLAEAWAGFELRLASGVDLEYLVRWESPELRRGIGSRSIVWGSVALTKSFGTN